MKNKWFLLLIILFSLTGCTVEYNLNINDNSIEEQIVLNEEKSKVDEETSDLLIKNTYSRYNDGITTLYKNSKFQKDNILSYVLSQNYTLRPATYFRTFSECFDAYNLVYANENRNSYILQTSKGFKCLEYDYEKIDSVKINIKTNHEVIEHNADEVNNTTYTWYIDSSNAKDKYISIEFKSVVKKKNNKESTNSEENEKKSDLDPLIILIGIGIIIGIVIIIIIYGVSLNNKRNKL